MKVGFCRETEPTGVPSICPNGYKRGVLERKKMKRSTYDQKNKPKRSDMTPAQRLMDNSGADRDTEFWIDIRAIIDENELLKEKTDGKENPYGTSS